MNRKRGERDEIKEGEMEECKGWRERERFSVCMNKNKVDDDNKQSITTTRAGRERERGGCSHSKHIWQISALSDSSYVEDFIRSGIV